MARIDNLGDKRNTNGLSANPQNINKAGRPRSLKKAFREILDNEEVILWVDKAEVLEQTIMRGKVAVDQIGIQLSGLNNLLVRLNKLAASKDDKVALESIKFIWNQYSPKFDITKLSDDQVKMLYHETINK